VSDTDSSVGSHEKIIMKYLEGRRRGLFESIVTVFTCRKWPNSLKVTHSNLLVRVYRHPRFKVGTHAIFERNTSGVQVGCATALIIRSLLVRVSQWKVTV